MLYGEKVTMTELKPPYILGLDVGTSSTRALLFDANGTTVPDIVSQRTYKLTTTSQGEVSVDADMLVDEVAHTISDVLQAAGPRAQQIGGVALDTFWHSLLGVDASGKPLMPVMTWEDTRAHSMIAELRRRFDEESLHARTGVRFHASYWPAKLLWLGKNAPDVLHHTAQWLSFGEYLHRKLLGRSVCSLSMASATGIFNTARQQWDSELQQELGIRADQLPPLGDAHDSVQGLQPEYAQLWPQLRDVPWFPALGDGATACIGSGSATPANWSLTIGTSSAIRAVVEPGQVTPPLGLWQYLIDSKRAVVGGALSEGGNMLNWICDAFKLPPLKEAEPQIADLPPDGHGLTILPFISGERSLGWHSNARMTITGISSGTMPGEVLRAGTEALAYQLYAVYQQLAATLHPEGEQHKLIGSGGALLSSDVLRGIISDTLGIALYPSLDHEASARGAALLALEALHLIPDATKVAPSLLAPATPNDQRGAIYRQASERQRQLYQRLFTE